MDHKQGEEYIDLYSFTRLQSPEINKIYALGYKNDNDPIFSIVCNGIRSRKVLNDFLKTYPADTFNFEYLEHY